MTLTAYRADDPPSEHSPPTPDQPAPLERAALTADVTTVAQRLLGTLLVRDDGATRRIARIVETEAYAGSHDRASHARAGMTPRTRVMFGPPGHAYVYLVYGLHHCLNVVCGQEGEAAAVLIRAVEPLAGVEAMRTARGRPGDPEARLAAGPARTCQALDIDRRLDGLDLLDEHRLWLAERPGDRAPQAIVSGPRIGVEYAGREWAAKPWRFGVADSAALSKPFRERD